MEGILLLLVSLSATPSTQVSQSEVLSQSTSALVYLILERVKLKVYIIQFLLLYKNIELFQHGMKKYLLPKETFDTSLCGRKSRVDQMDPTSSGNDVANPQIIYHCTHNHTKYHTLHSNAYVNSCEYFARKLPPFLFSSTPPPLLNQISYQITAEYKPT